MNAAAAVVAILPFLPVLQDGDEINIDHHHQAVHPRRRNNHHHHDDDGQEPDSPPDSPIPVDPDGEEPMDEDDRRRRGAASSLFWWWWPESVTNLTGPNMLPIAGLVAGMVIGIVTVLPQNKNDNDHDDRPVPSRFAAMGLQTTQPATTTTTTTLLVVIMFFYGCLVYQWILCQKRLLDMNRTMSNQMDVLLHMSRESMNSLDRLVEVVNALGDELSRGGTAQQESRHRASTRDE